MIAVSLVLAELAPFMLALPIPRPQSLIQS
jgi:hypothetical protein